MNYDDPVDGNVTRTVQQLGLTGTLNLNIDGYFNWTYNPGEADIVSFGGYTSDADQVTMTDGNTHVANACEYFFLDGNLYVKMTIDVDIDNDGTLEFVPATLKFTRQTVE